MPRLHNNTIQASLLPWHSVVGSRNVYKIGFFTRLSIFLARIKRFEFWPLWLFYFPIIVWIILLGIRYRSLTLFTAANPVIDAGGLVGEKKHMVLKPLQDNLPNCIAPFKYLPTENEETNTANERIELATQFANMHCFPLVLKPDVGQRGRGVFVAKNTDDVLAYIQQHKDAIILQKYIPGEEFGVFILKDPKTSKVSILSIVQKSFPHLVGDGKKTIRELILADNRSRLISQILFKKWVNELEVIPKKGNEIAMVSIGAHCRGCTFEDANDIASEKLVDALSKIVDAIPGYYFGRLDIKVPNKSDFINGINIKILEVNGVSAESAHIYHPGSSIIEAYSTMFKQWSLAFKIGQYNSFKGTKTTGLLALWQAIMEDRIRDKLWF